MAEKKTTKTDTKKKDDIKEEVKDTPKKRKTVKQIDRNELIPCKNVCDNIVVYVSQRTGLKYRWSNYGDVEYIEFGELITMNSSYPKFLREPWIIPEDEDVIEALNLDKIYEKLIPLDEIEDFFTQPLDNIKNAIKKAPKGNQEALVIRAIKMIKDGTLYDTRIIKLIEDELKVTLGNK